MEYDKENLAVMHCGTNSDMRYGLDGVYFEPNGDTIATDTHVLAVCENKNRIKGNDNENLGQIIPYKAVRELSKNVGKRNHSLFLKEANKDKLTVDFMIKDESDGSGAIVSINTIDGRFPDYKKCIPKFGLDKPSIILGLPVLEKIVKTMKDFQKKDEAKMIKMYFKDADSPVKFIAENDEKKMTIVAMPMHEV